MADASKTIEIIFEGETTDAEAKVGALADALGRIDQAADPTAVNAYGEAVDSVGAKSGDSATSVGILETSIKSFAEGLGVPKDKVDDLTAAFGRLGVGQTAALVVVGTALAAFGIAALDAGKEAFDFQTKVENLTGSAETAKAEWEFVRKAVSDLETDLGNTATEYSKFLNQLTGTQIPSGVAQDAFVGIMRALEGVGQQDKASSVLTSFVEAAKDGDISVRDLNTKIRDIPGGLTAFAESLGVTTTELYKMAEQGDLGKTAIATFASYLADMERADLNPVSNALTDLVNTLKSAALDMGAEGAFAIGLTAIEKVIRAITVAVTTSSSVVTLFGETIANIAATVATGDWSGFVERFGESWDKATGQVDKSAKKLFGDSDSVAANAKAAGDAGEDAAGRMGTAFEDAGTKASGALGSFKTDVEDVNKALKDLGVDEKKFTDPLDKVKAALGSLFDNPAVTGDQLLAGLQAALVKLPPDAALAAEALQKISTAVDNGTLSVEQGAAARGELELWQNGIAKTLDELTNPALTRNKDALDKSAKAALDAQKAADDFMVKMEQIASNERIKLIESVVKIDVAQIEADAKVAVAAFESISATVDSTGKVLSDLFGILAGGTKDWATWRKLIEAIDLEQERRTEAMKKQNELLQAQIDLANARTAALQAGGAVINIDGAGLQPHLEAFMWEILRTIQVRVNSDGLEMLLGV